MKYPLLLILTALLLFATSGFAQTGKPADDDVFNLFLFAYAVAFLGIAGAAILIGAVIMVGFLAALFALASAGVLSTGILVGLYRRSLAAGFRTLVVLVCGLGGLFTGAIGLWLVDRIFGLSWKFQTILLTGALGGLAGGMLLGLIVVFILRAFFRYCKQRLAL
jgi:hypothetical protein